MWGRFTAFRVQKSNNCSKLELSGSTKQELYGFDDRSQKYPITLRTA